MTDKDQDPADEETPSPLVAVLQCWLFLAVLGQLMHLAGWPVRITGEALSRTPSVLIALLRMSVYLGLISGLRQRTGTAWAVLVLELGRSSLQFWAPLVLDDGGLGGSFYPAAWTQGLLSAFLPVLGIFSVAVAWGWSPGAHLEALTSTAAYLTSGIALMAAWRLLEHAHEFGVSRRSALVVLVTGGLPLALLLLAGERLALLASSR